jgi:hypothetical protein
MDRREVNMPDPQGVYGWMADSVCRRFLGLWLMLTAARGRVQ